MISFLLMGNQLGEFESLPKVTQQRREKVRIMLHSFLLNTCLIPDLVSVINWVWLTINTHPPTPRWQLKRKLSRVSPWATAVWRHLRQGWRWNMRVLAPQSCPALCLPTDRSPPGSSVHGILQARSLKWVAFSGVSSQPRDWNWVSWIASSPTLGLVTRKDFSEKMTLKLRFTCQEGNKHKKIMWGWIFAYSGIFRDQNIGHCNHCLPKGGRDIGNEMSETREGPGTWDTFRFTQCCGKILEYFK